MITLLGSLRGFAGIALVNRIVASGVLNSVVNGVTVNPAIGNAIADSGAVPSLVVPGGSYSVSLFTNGIDTRTRGVDFTLARDCLPP